MRLALALAGVIVMALLGPFARAEGSPAGCVAARVYSSGSPPTAGGPRGVRWMRAGSVVGYLFGYGEALRRVSPGRAALFTGGTGLQGEAMKILWAVRGGRRVVSVAGHRLDGPGTFLEGFPSVGVTGARNDVYYASTVDIPSAGCWRFTVRSLGTRGRFAVLGIDK